MYTKYGLYFVSFAPVFYVKKHSEQLLKEHFGNWTILFGSFFKVYKYTYGEVVRGLRDSASLRPQVLRG